MLLVLLATSLFSLYPNGILTPNPFLKPQSLLLVSTSLIAFQTKLRVARSLFEILKKREACQHWKGPWIASIPTPPFMIIESKDPEATSSVAYRAAELEQCAAVLIPHLRIQEKALSIARPLYDWRWYVDLTRIGNETEIVLDTQKPVEKKESLSQVTGELCASPLTSPGDEQRCSHEGSDLLLNRFACTQDSSQVRGSKFREKQDLGQLTCQFADSINFAAMGLSHRHIPAL
ncbi:hypothetical protein MG293_009499 [Ovis ammon polii]|uniref:Leptin receptor n=1 Tax=Ovis ammon polii TaxID=230172 RepID=A0AAD4U6R1_OVIAM|nr:hypothetical protein MG293_009499 [Ovis ammon polii]